MKKFTLSLLSLLTTLCFSAKAEVFGYDLSAPGFGGTAGADFANWYYFSFETGQIVGSSVATLENVNGGGIGTEVINPTWKAKTDWDIAFKAMDIRTNSGAGGNAGAGCLLIANSESGQNLDEVYANLAEAPDDTYLADQLLTGVFYFSMASMPPPRTTQLSACSVTNGWATIGMNPADNVVKPMVVVFKTSAGNYVKVYLKEFFGDGTTTPAVGNLVMEYEFIPLEGTASVNEVERDKFFIYMDSAMGQLEVDLAQLTNADITIYNLTGLAVKQVKGKSGQVSVPVSGLPQGTYIVKIDSYTQSRTQKIIIK